MRRLLMLCYYFPPLGGIGSVRSLKLAMHLPAFGWESCVVAPRDGTYFRDPTLEAAATRVIRTPSIEISRLGRRAVGAADDAFAAAQVGTTLSRVRDFVRRWLYYPDPQVGWLPFAIAAGRAALRDRRYDAVFSTSFPVSAHLAARRVAREAGLPWVAEFRDPWADVLPEAHPRRSAAFALEAALVRDAAAVITPSAEWASLFSRKGARRVEVVTNGVDPADVPLPEPPADPVLAYVGTFYPAAQTLAPAWHALAALRREAPFRRARIRVVGTVHPGFEEELRAHGLGDALDVTGFLPYRAALRAMASASVLLLAGPRGSAQQRHGQIAAKTFEYLATGLPIVYVGDLDAEVTSLLRAHPGCFLARPDDPVGARRALEAAFAEGRHPREVSAFTRHALAGRVATLLDDLC